MSVDQNALEALRLESLDVPVGLKVEGMRVEELLDADGDEALRVTVIVSDDTRFGPNTARRTLDLKRAIRDSLRRRGVTLFPYVFITTPSEEAEVKAEAESEARTAESDEG